MLEEEILKLVVLPAIGILLGMVVGSEYNLWRVERKIKKYAKEYKLREAFEEIAKMGKAFFPSETPEKPEEIYT